MNPPTNKTELLARIRQAHTELEALLSSLNEAQLTQPGAVGTWAVKDVLAHLLAWEQYANRQLQAAARHESGQIPLFSADDPEDTDQLNALIVQRAHAAPVAQLRDDLGHSLHTLSQTLEGCTEADLFQPDGLQRWLNYQALDVIAGNSYEHFEEHLAALHEWRGAQWV